MPKVVKELILRRKGGASREGVLVPLGKTRVALARLPMLLEPNRAPSWPAWIGSSVAMNSLPASQPMSCRLLLDSLGDQAIMNTPANVAAQPYKNVTT